MSILDERIKLNKLDKSNMLGSIEALPDQIAHAWQDAQKVIIPTNYQHISNVVVSGMGGSTFGSYVIKNLYKKTLKVPFEIVSHYELPEYVGENTLVLLSSYSGATEETLEAATDAKNRGAKIMVITSGGQLAELASKNSWPAYIIDAKYNPCDQPRLAVGYAIVGQLALFKNAKLLVVDDKEIITTISGLKSLITKLSPDNSDNNLGKSLAFQAYDKQLVIVAAEHLIGAAHVFNNQLNENGKILTSEWPLPEFNHHYMEALKFPAFAKHNTLFILINSALYHDRVIKRVPLTQRIIDNAGFESVLIQATAPTHLEQVFEIIMLSEYVAYYLPMLYGIDPSKIPTVESFKLALA